MEKTKVSSPMKNGKHMPKHTATRSVAQRREASWRQVSPSASARSSPQEHAACLTKKRMESHEIQALKLGNYLGYSLPQLLPTNQTACSEPEHDK